MRLEGSIHVVVESKKKKGGATEPNIALQSMSTLGVMKDSIMPMEVTPMKIINQQSAIEKDLGSTQLRKTVFKKHYADKTKLMG